MICEHNINYSEDEDSIQHADNGGVGDSDDEDVDGIEHAALSGDLWHNTVPEPDLAAQEVNKGFQVPAHNTVLVAVCVYSMCVCSMYCVWCMQWLLSF